MHDSPLIKYAAWERPPSKRDLVAQELRRAFPVPESGTFSDVLQAISEAERKSV
jgi:hypothetical protein